MNTLERFKIDASHRKYSEQDVRRGGAQHAGRRL